MFDIGFFSQKKREKERKSDCFSASENYTSACINMSHRALELNTVGVHLNEIEIIDLLFACVEKQNELASASLSVCSRKHRNIPIMILLRLRQHFNHHIFSSTPHDVTI